MTIGKKLLGGIGVLAGAFALYTGFTAYEMNRIAETQRLASEVAISLKYAGQIDTLVASMTADQRNLMIESVLGETATVDRVAAEFEAHATALSTAISALQNHLSTAEERQLMGDIASRLPAWQQTFAGFRQLCTAQQIAAAETYRNEKVDPLAADMDRLANNFILMQDRDLERSEQRNRESVAVAKVVSAAALGLCVLVAVAIILLTRTVVRSIQSITSELGLASEQVAGAAAELAASSQALAQGASEQSASVEETSASSEEINAITRENTSSAAQAAELMGGAAEQISVANRKLGQLIESMKEIGNSSDKISKIIKIIDEIAFQTNLLALNAAVEAARAGEAGMGFAVVADEVRNLAQRCAQAASDTTGLIEESINNARNGSRRLTDVANAVTAITASADQVKTLIDKVNSGSIEQTRGIDHVARAVAQIESVTQRAAANAEQAASASEELSGQAAGLRGLVARLGDLAGAAATIRAE